MNKEKKEQQIDGQRDVKLHFIYAQYLVDYPFCDFFFKDSEFLPLDVQLLVTLLINSTSQWCSEQVKKIDAMQTNQ